MFKNHITVAIRTLLRHKVFSLINIFGLAIGMAGCVIIGLIVKHELAFDTHHENADRIYRVIRETKPSGSQYMGIGTSGALAGALKADFPEIEHAIRVHGPHRADIRYHDHTYWQNIVTADPEILNIFTIPFVKGNPQTALDHASNVVITEALAETIFGDEEPIGKMLTRGSSKLIITGVVANVPAASSFKFDLLKAVSKTPSWSAWTEWRPNYSYRPICTYILLQKNADPKTLEQKLPAFIHRHLGSQMAQSVAFYLQPLTRVHLYSRSDYGLTDSRVDTEGMDQSTSFYSDISYVRMFGLMAAFLLIVAAVNFTILATARATGRAREVGIRKVLGATRLNLIPQFLGEAILISSIALVFAIGICELVLPLLNAFLGYDLSLTITQQTDVIFALLSSALFIGICAGCYPAFFLSAFQPVWVLKSTPVSDRKGIGIRSALVTLQFAISISLVIGTLVVSKQTQYFHTKPLGFAKDQIVIVPIFSADNSLKKRYREVKHAFLKHPNISSASACAPHPGMGTERQLVRPEGKTDHQWQMQILGIDEDFLDTFNIELIAGRNIDPNMPTDRGHAYILNETAVRELGWTNPVGKNFQRYGARQVGTVIGVVRDFHVQSLHQPVEPVFLCIWDEMWYLACCIGSENISETLAFMKTSWNQFVKDKPFSYYFLNDHLDRMYHAEVQLTQTFAVFSALAIFIACLGLFGLAAFTTQQRTKEIGIRKILGASVSGIVCLLSKDFLKLVIFANLIAWPIAYYAMNQWLQSFAYRIDLGIGTFILSGLIALLIAILTVSYQAIKAARANPVEALRYE